MKCMNMRRDQMTQMADVTDVIYCTVQGDYSDVLLFSYDGRLLETYAIAYHSLAAHPLPWFTVKTVNVTRQRNECVFGNDVSVLPIAVGRLTLCQYDASNF